MSTPELKREIFNIGAMHKNARGAFSQLISATATQPFRTKGFAYCTFRPFEGFRHPMRQLYLFHETKSTKAGPWESAHQYGLAVDFAVWVAKDDGSSQGFWTWPNDAPWIRLAEMARMYGLDVPIEWDRGHVEHPMFKWFRNFTK